MLNYTELSRFRVESGASQWNRIARAMATERQTGVAENARTFALLNMAFSDAYAVVFETKYRFNFWRPIHAIRENDGATQYVDARVFGGIHFRRTCVISNEVGRKIAKFAMKNSLRPAGRDDS